MLLIIGVAIALIAGGIIHRIRMPGRADPTNLGCMSEQWLAEHRASHLP